MHTFSSLDGGDQVRGGRFLPLWRDRRGFSLVEATLSVGLLSFAFIVLLGLLPAGLTVFREAMDTSVTAQIAQRVAADLQESDYFALRRQASLTDDETVSYGTLPRRFFDDQGNEIPTAKDGKPSEYDRPRTLYEVHVRLAGRADSRNLSTAVIQIVNNPAGKELKEDPETRLLDLKALKLPVQTYPALVARNGSEAR